MASLGKDFPDFKVVTTQGRIHFHEWLGDSWGILFSYPADYSPVCTTELAWVIAHTDKFKARNVKMIALSGNSIEDHLGWSKDVKAFNVRGGHHNKEMTFPIIADPNRTLALKFGMLDPNETDAQGISLPARAVFVVGPDKKLKLSMHYPATTGRNFDEILRVIDSLQLTANKRVATPVNWKAGDKCMVLPNIPPAEAKELFPDHGTVTLPSGKGYLRLTPQP